MDKRKLKRVLVGEFTIKRLMRSVILVPVLIYGGMFFYALFFVDRIIFQPPKSAYRDSNTTIKLRTVDGAQISGVYLQNPNATYTILYSHGNAEDLATLAPLLEDIRRIGFSVFAYDYHGYGTSSGTPSETNAYRDIDAAYYYLAQILHTPTDHIIVHGRSLGGAVAVDLASRKPVGGLVVESSFVTAFRVLTRIPLFPIDKFRNADKIKRVRCPVLVIHGRLDDVIPFWHGERLFALANEPKMSLWVDGAAHNDLPELAGKKYEQALQAFRDSLGALPHAQKLMPPSP